MEVDSNCLSPGSRSKLGEIVYACFNHVDEFCNLLDDRPNTKLKKNNQRQIGKQYGYCNKCKGETIVKQRVRCAKCSQQFFMSGDTEPLKGDYYNCKVEGNARGIYFYNCSKHDIECNFRGNMNLFPIRKLETCFSRFLKISSFMCRNHDFSFSDFGQQNMYQRKWCRNTYFNIKLIILEVKKLDPKSSFQHRKFKNRKIYISLFTFL